MTQASQNDRQKLIADVQAQQQQQITSIKTHIDSSIGSLAQQTSALQTAVAAHDQRITATENQQSDSTRKHTSLENRVAELESLVRSLSTNTPMSSTFTPTPTPS